MSFKTFCCGMKGYLWEAAVFLKQKPFHIIRRRSEQNVFKGLIDLVAVASANCVQS